MKNLTTLALLCALTACTGCESTPEVAPTTPPQELKEVVAPPASTTKFAVGDKAILTVPPNGETFDVEIAEITEVREFGTGNGDEVQASQGYVVVVTREIKTEQGTMVVHLGLEVPEFALTHKRDINERNR